MNNKGFTLIELVVVIVILGILAVTAVPKYINLSADAETSVLAGIKAAMQGASSLVYGKAIVAGNQSVPESDNPTITLSDGTQVALDYGYPTVASLTWQEILQLDANEFLIASVSGVIIVYDASLELTPTASADCIVTYVQAEENATPTITVNPCV